MKAEFFVLTSPSLDWALHKEALGLLFFLLQGLSLI